MMQPILDKKYRVAYGYQQTFDLTEIEAQALTKAKEQGLDMAKFSDRVFSTNFTWLVPVSEVEYERLDEDELKMAEMVGKWLAKPVHDLDFTDESAMRYSKKLVKRIGVGLTKKLWDNYADCNYPSAKRFLTEAKEISTLEIPANLGFR